jgi:putative hydrolases of HD superfamily
MTGNLTDLTHFLYELGTLRKIARSHRQTLLTNDLSDNIASHSYRVTLLGWFLAHLEKADPYQVIMMCLFHDTAETRTGDQNWVHKKYIKAFDGEASGDQLSSVPGAADLLKIKSDYEKRTSPEAKLAKDADLLDQILLLKEYAWQGNREAEEWLKDNQQIKRLFGNSAKRLAAEILAQNPSDWWTRSGWSAERRK